MRYNAAPEGAAFHVAFQQNKESFSERIKPYSPGFAEPL